MMKLIALILMFVVRSAIAQEWTDGQKKLLAGALALTTIDMLQTTYIARNPDKWHELNPMMGPHPSVGRVRVYMIGSMIGMSLLSHYVPTYRNQILTMWISIEGVNVARNAAIGVRVSF